jgi:ribosomal protein S18 acetylase RimI-like enzyme
MVNKIKIRKARKEDIEKIWELETESRKWHKKITKKKYIKLNKTNINEKAKKEFIKGLNNDIKKKKNVILVALINNQIVGWAVAHIYKWMCSDNPPLITKIGDLAILKEFRKRGIATELIKEIEKEYKKRNSKFIYVGTLLNNKPAYKLYKKMKYKDFHLEMFKKIK